MHLLLALIPLDHPLDPPLDPILTAPHVGLDPLVGLDTFRISIISVDSARQSKICKVDVRTRGGVSYSFGQHCTNGVAQTLLFFPGLFPPRQRLTLCGTEEV